MGKARSLPALDVRKRAHPPTKRVTPLDTRGVPLDVLQAAYPRGYLSPCLATATSAGFPAIETVSGLVLLTPIRGAADEDHLFVVRRGGDLESIDRDPNHHSYKQRKWLTEGNLLPLLDPLRAPTTWFAALHDMMLKLVWGQGEAAAARVVTGLAWQRANGGWCLSVNTETGDDWRVSFPFTEPAGHALAKARAALGHGLRDTAAIVRTAAQFRVAP